MKMSNYEKQNFVSGQILKAEHLNHIEDGIEQLSEEIAELSTGTRDAEQEWGLIVGAARSDKNFTNWYVDHKRITNEAPIPVDESTVIIVESPVEYLWSIASYDDNGTFLNSSGWKDIISAPIDFAGYININVKRKDDALVTEEDSDTIRRNVKIVSRSAVYIKTINGIAPDSDGNFNLDDAQDAYTEYTLINGVANGHTGEFEYNAANRATTKDFISVVNGAEIHFTGAGTYNYSPICMTADMESIGYMGWIDNPVFELNYTGYLKLNIKRKDEGNISTQEFKDIANLLKVRPKPIENPTREYKLEVRADLINSLYVEYGRSDGASWQFVRIPHETNDGRKVRPVVRLTSEDGSLTGEKCSVPAYAERENTAFVINAGLFDVSTDQPLGQTIIDGVSIVNTPHPQGANNETISETECYPLCIDSNGVLSAPYPKTVDTATMIADGIVQACSGWIKIVENYEILADEIATEIVHPQPYVQQIIGQFFDGDYCVLSVANKGYTGSDPNDNGLTYTQCAQLLVNKGVKFAYALDGGGSCQTVIGKRQINPRYDGRAAPAVIVFKAT